MGSLGGADGHLDKKRGCGKVMSGKSESGVGDCMKILIQNLNAINSKIDNLTKPLYDEARLLVNDYVEKHYNLRIGQEVEVEGGTGKVESFYLFCGIIRCRIALEHSSLDTTINHIIHYHGSTR